MTNLFGHLVLNVTLLSGVIDCLYHVDPFLAYAMGLWFARDLHALSVKQHVADAVDAGKG